jgi:hypothetical protein
MGIISAIANVVSGGLAITKPLVDQKLAQQYETANIERLEDWKIALNTVDASSRAVSLFKCIDELCTTGGQPAGGLSGNFSVPVSHLNSLVILASNGIRDKRTLESANYAIRERS